MAWTGRGIVGAAESRDTLQRIVELSGAKSRPTRRYLVPFAVRVRRGTGCLQVGIDLALEKTELIIPTRKRTHNTLDIMVKGQLITSRPSVKYLGIHLDQRINFRTHALSFAQKADSVTRSLRAIFPNTRGTWYQARKLLAAVPHSMLLYGAPIWSRNMSVAGVKALGKFQRRIALRVAKAYRTISGDALLVVAGIPPIDLLAVERADLHEGRKARRTTAKISTEARRKLMEKWQERWSASEKGVWLRRLIPDIAPWSERRHGCVTFHLTQALSGHGCFSEYLRRFNLLPTAECWFCGDACDDANHTLFMCNAWQTRRAQLAEEIGAFTPDNLVDKMVKDRQTWDAATAFITGVMKEKEAEERRRQSGQQP